MYLLVRYFVGSVGCVGFFELKGVECICLLTILLDLFGALGLLDALGLLNVYAC